jgi:hypothetical protein
LDEIQSHMPFSLKNLSWPQHNMGISSIPMSMEKGPLEKKQAANKRSNELIRRIAMYYVFINFKKYR